MRIMKADKGEFDRFTDFMRRLVAVPHSEIKAKLDAEKKAKGRTPKPSASPVSPAPNLKPAFLPPCLSALRRSGAFPRSESSQK